jgi:spore maturation protein CgeB
VKILCVFGEHNYGDPSRGHGYEYTNFLPALKRLGHEIIFFESFNRSHYGNFSELNRAFLKVTEKEKPDVILCVLMHYELWTETLEIVRKNCDTRLLNWSTDDSWKYEQFSSFMAPHFDVFATTCRSAFTKSRNEGLKNLFLTQWAANSERLSEPLSARRCRYAVSFIGTAYGNRRKWIQNLNRRGIDVSCFGHGWPQGPVRADEIARIIRESVVSLNLGDSGLVLSGLNLHRSRQIKARTFEVPGCGGFLMTESADDLNNYYVRGKEIVVFDSLDDLEDKIRHYLANPDERDKIAMAGYLRTCDDHTYDKRFQKLLFTASQLRSASAKQRKCDMGSDELSELEKAHSLRWYLRLFRAILIGPCMLFWGRVRGRRAARRALFEISWRVCGKCTYRATGLPGRLFYLES